MKNQILAAGLMVASLGAQAESVALSSDHSLVGLFASGDSNAQVVVEATAEGKVAIMSFAFNFIIEEPLVVSDDRLSGGKLILSVGEAQLNVERRRDSSGLNQFTLMLRGQTIRLEPRIELSLGK